MASDTSLGTSEFIPSTINNYSMLPVNRTLEYASSQTQYPNDQQNIKNMGLRDKYDASAGLSAQNASDVQYSVFETSITVDTRDCVGMNSLLDAQSASIFNGSRDSVYGFVINASNTSPIVMTLDSVVD